MWVHGLHVIRQGQLQIFSHRCAASSSSARVSMLFKWFLSNQSETAAADGSSKFTLTSGQCDQVKRFGQEPFWALAEQMVGLLSGHVCNANSLRCYLWWIMNYVFRHQRTNQLHTHTHLSLSSSSANANRSIRRKWEISNLTNLLFIPDWNRQVNTHMLIGETGREDESQQINKQTNK